ncbi:MAG: DUF6702 family protein [Pseudomonadales bacterium]
MISRITGLLFLLAFGFSSAVFAHAPDQSYTFLTIDDEKVEGRFEVSTKDLNLVMNLGLAEDVPPTMEEILVHRQAISDYLLENVSLSIDGASKDIDITSFEQLNVAFAKYVLVYFDLPALSAPAKEIEIGNNLFFDHDDKHRSLLIVENNWKTGTIQNEAYVSLNFSPDSRQQTLAVDSGSSLRGLWGFIEQGMHHIWIGTDHILFLIALLLPSVMVREGGRWVATPDFRSAFIGVIKIVTVFTVAHSITLSAAALDVLSLDSRLVESIIAISIAAAALHVLWPVFAAHAFWVVLLFGLFHGFGFASVMSELWIPEKYLVWSLLGFNIGVELGQLAIVVLVVPVLFVLRKTAFYQRVVMPLGAAALIAISLYWFAERALDVDFAAGDRLRALVSSSSL